VWDVDANLHGFSSVDIRFPASTRSHSPFAPVGPIVHPRCWVLSGGTARSADVPIADL